MSSGHYLDSLNDRQRAAVEAPDGPILILAGAGSGKTRVLTHRMAHLIDSRGVDPTQIFAVTFTNKAAAEMRHRVMSLLAKHCGMHVPEGALWVSTFHSACVRILRQEIHRLDYSNQFTIYDDADQLSVVKAVLKELNLSESQFSPKAMQVRINKVKNDGHTSETYQPSYGGPLEDAFVRVFIRYSEVLKTSSALDFGDLILRTVDLFRREPKLLEVYQSRFPYVLVDEYQDTNRCQYLLMKQMAGMRANLCAVGDEDQSIYRWRGADITNILNFEHDYPTAQIFKLEENYRSTRNIIEAASHVISFNTERRDKRLWTSNEEGEPISVLECYDEQDESFKVASEVVGLISNGVALNEVAIFYRTNAQSRLLEDMFRAKGINYQIFGGLKFYDRLEVKDSLAYLKLIANPKDDVSLRRIINVPTRGIGAVSVERLQALSVQKSLTHYETLSDMFLHGGSGAEELGRGAKNFKTFFEMMEGFRKVADSLLPSDLLNHILEESGYRKSLTDEATVESQSRLENLAELRQSLVEYELRQGADHPEKPITLSGFLEEIALVSDSDRFDPYAPALKMMTIHMAKGLEFDHVFIVGLEEELFPSVRAWEGEDPKNVEEERRLFYVGMTRARKKLTLLFAKNRTVFGSPQFRVRSRFIDEVPENYRQEKKADFFSRRRSFSPRAGLPPGADAASEVPQDAYEEFSQITHEDGDVYSDVRSDMDASPDFDENAFRKGSRVLHPTFGEGVVHELLGADKLMVNFKGRGLKKISLKFTQLKGV